MRNGQLTGLLLLPMFGGCFTFVQPPSYEMPLEAVRRPADVAQRWGEYVIEAADSSGFTYEDALVSVAIVPVVGTFRMSVENKTEHSLQIVWNEATYVGVNGIVSRVSPGNTRVMDMEREQPPTVVPAGARAIVTAIPNDYYVTSSYGGYTRDFLCVRQPFGELQDSEARLVLPIRVQDVTNEYTFVFRLHNFADPPRSPSGSQQRYDPAKQCP